MKMNDNKLIAEFGKHGDYDNKRCIGCRVSLGLRVSKNEKRPSWLVSCCSRFFSCLS